MSERIREQLHQMIDRLDSRDLLSVRMFIDEMRPPSDLPGRQRHAKRISIAEYRKEMGLVESER